MNIEIQYPKNYAIYDLETTGVDPLTAEITEIAIRKVSNDGDKEETKSWLIKTKNPIPDEVVQITGITNEMLEADGVLFEDAWAEIFEMLGDSVIIGHNIVNYDNVILERYVKELAYPEPWKNNNPARDLIQLLQSSHGIIDTAPLMKTLMMKASDQWKDSTVRHWFETNGSYNARIMDVRAYGIKWNLANSCVFLGIDVSDLVAHRAEADVEMVDRIYKKLTV